MTIDNIINWPFAAVLIVLIIAQTVKWGVKRQTTETNELTYLRREVGQLKKKMDGEI